jgi:hypothetical protein
MLQRGAMEQGHLGTQDFLPKTNLEVTKKFSFLDLEF